MAEIPRQMIANEQRQCQGQISFRLYFSYSKQLKRHHLCRILHDFDHSHNIISFDSVQIKIAEIFDELEQKQRFIFRWQIRGTILNSQQLVDRWNRVTSRLRRPIQLQLLILLSLFSCNLSLFPLFMKRKRWLDTLSCNLVPSFR